MAKYSWVAGGLENITAVADTTEETMATCLAINLIDSAKHCAEVCFVFKFKVAASQ